MRIAIAALIVLLGLCGCTTPQSTESLGPPTIINAPDYIDYVSPDGREAPWARAWPSIGLIDVWVPFDDHVVCSSTFPPYSARVVASFVGEAPYPLDLMHGAWIDSSRSNTPTLGGAFTLAVEGDTALVGGAYTRVQTPCGVQTCVMPLRLERRLP